MKKKCYLQGISPIQSLYVQFSFLLFLRIFPLVLGNTSTTSILKEQPLSFLLFNCFTYLFRSAWLLYIVSSKENQENKPCKLTWIVGWYTNWKINESPFSSVCILFLTLLLKNLLYTRHHHSKSIYQRWWDFGFSWWKLWIGILQPR